MANSDRLRRRLKRLLDLALAVPALLISAPLLALIALAIRVNMGSPVLFRQRRPGLGEHLFTLYKFRTMHPPGPGRESDTSRTPRLGRWLRRTSFDELPELINVVRGHMSLVGPRPLLPRYLPHYTERERLRHSVLPGLTGWAQIQGRNLLSWDHRLTLDVWYVEHWSLRLDLYILLKTPGAVFSQHGVVLDQGSRLPDPDQERSRPRP
jgi:lipopolysaccharide/colanic/teichoic acid biosynthesis glycosyltransferase